MGTCFRSGLRTVLAGSLLLGGAIAGAVTIGASPASATTETASINVGSDPVATAVDEVTDVVYVANQIDNTVSVINGATNTVTNTISVGNEPSALAVDASTDSVYVANQIDNTVSVINGATNTVTNTISVGGGPFGVAVNAATDTVYVTNDDGTLSVINGATDTVSDTITITADGLGDVSATPLAVDAATDTVYVANYFDGGVVVVNGATNTVTGTIGTDSSVGNSGTAAVAVDPITDTIYAVDAGFEDPQFSDVAVINGATSTLTDTIPFYGDLLASLAVDAATDTVYLTNETQNTPYFVGGFSVIDGATNTFIDECAFATQYSDCPFYGNSFNVDGTGAGVAVDAANGIVYVGNPDFNSVAIFTPFQITTTVLGSGTAGTAYNATVSTTGGTGPYAWSVLSGNLPPGLNLDPSTGTISGTATTAGTYDFTVQVTDSESLAQTAIHSLAITVAPSGQVQITTRSLSDGIVGQPYSATVQAVGGNSPYRFWYAKGGSLPRGLHFDSVTGVLSGVPSRAGTYTVTFRVRDTKIAQGTPRNRATATLTITIVPA